MLALSYERRHRVVMVKVTGVLSSEDIESHDRIMLGFLAGKDGVRAIYDFSNVEALAVPVSKIAQRGQRPAIVTGRRVVVAQRQGGEDFARIIATEQRAAGLAEPAIVSTLAEACELLGLGRDTVFEPLEG